MMYCTKHRAKQDGQSTIDSIVLLIILHDLIICNAPGTSIINNSSTTPLNTNNNNDDVIQQKQQHHQRSYRSTFPRHREYFHPLRSLHDCHTYILGILLLEGVMGIISEGCFCCWTTTTTTVVWFAIEE